MARVSTKLYRCTRCGFERLLLTNHYMQCYPHCRQCNTHSPHDCIELLRLAREVSNEVGGA